MRRYISDPELRAKLTPHYRAGCKRILISDNFYQAVADPKTEVITDGIARVTPHGIVTVDGTERPVDAIVLATGFHVTDSFNYRRDQGCQRRRSGGPLDPRRNGRRTAASRSPTCPNLFFLLGPNTALGHNSVVFMIESQIRYVAAAIAAVDKGVQALAPTRAAQDQFNDKLQSDLSTTVWNTGGCRSWYLDEHGVNRALWSGLASEYWLATRSFEPSEYRFCGRRRPTTRRTPARRCRCRCPKCPTTPSGSVVAMRDPSCSVAQDLSCNVKRGSGVRRNEADRPRLGDQLEPRCRTRRTPRSGTG